MCYELKYYTLVRERHLKLHSKYDFAPSRRKKTSKELKHSWGSLGGHPQFLSLLNFLRSLLLPKNVFLRVKLGLENFHVPFGENVVLKYRGWNCPRVQQSPQVWSWAERGMPRSSAGQCRAARSPAEVQGPVRNPAEQRRNGESPWEILP